MSEFKQVVSDGAKKVGHSIKKVFFIILALLIVGGGIYLWVCNWTYSEGTRAGHLIKISRKGVVWKTYEGQLNLGGINSDPNSGLTGNIWDFSVNKKGFPDVLENYQGQQVKLHYREVYKAMPWQGKTNYLVTDVELVGAPTPGSTK